MYQLKRAPEFYMPTKLLFSKQPNINSFHHPELKPIKYLTINEEKNQEKVRRISEDTCCRNKTEVTERIRRRGMKR